jgi:hypothetical protein
MKIIFKLIVKISDNETDVFVSWGLSYGYKQILKINTVAKMIIK